MAKSSKAAVNVLLAAALKELDPRWSSGQLLVETSQVFQENLRLRPDLLLRAPYAQPVVIETEFAPALSVQSEARDRLGLTLVESGESVAFTVALCLPKTLREAQNSLKERIKAADYRYCVFGHGKQFPTRWPQKGWLDGTLYDVAQCLEHLMVSEAIVEESLKVLESAVRAASTQISWATQAGFPDLEHNLGRVLNQKPGEQTTRMAMTIIANALAFHAALAGTNGIPPLQTLTADRATSLQHSVAGVWQRILDEINYWPVFKVAIDLITPLKMVTANRVLEILIKCTHALSGLGINTRHDLVGKMFQRLIIDRKFLATFYTRPTSSTLLAELAIARLSHDWNDLKSYPQLRVADLACGTGTLLSAAYHAILTQYRHAGGNDELVHKAMIESALIAADIMPAAVHLCASQLSSVHPTVLFDRTCVYAMPYGRRQGDAQASGIALGSLSLLKSNKAMSLFPTGDKQVSGKSNSDDAAEFVLPDKSLDLVIMNPPFTRPTNHKKTEVPVPSFAGFNKSEEEQRAMAQELKGIYRGLVKAAGNGNAGLASRFVDLAHAKVKPGGVVAFVLPITVLRGKAWQAVRNLWASDYRDLVVVTIAAVRSRDRAFSADTDMAEMLMVATRGDQFDDSCSERALYVNLHDRPSNLLEAAEIARQCRTIPSATDSGLIRAGEDVLGTYIRAPLTESGCAALRHASLAEFMLALCQGKLKMPRYAQIPSLPITQLGQLGQRGLVHRDIYGSLEKSPPYRGPFEIVPLGDTPNYPALWNHDASKERAMQVYPDSEGLVRPDCNEKAIRVWQTATRLHFTLDFGLSSQSLAACLTSELSLGGRAWPNFRLDFVEWEHLICLWTNSTLGIMSAWWHGSRQHPGRAIQTVTGLPELSVVDARALPQDKIRKAAELFDQYKDETLLPANEAFRDDVRKQIDEALLVHILDLPREVLLPLERIRLQWCSEPTVHGGKSTRPS